VPSSLARLQAARLSTTQQLNVFSSVEEARAWLFAGLAD
jgi:hypothetical protein